MDQTSFLFQNELYIKVDKKNNGTSKFLKMFESVNKEKESKENSSNDYYEEAFLPKDLFQDNNLEEEEKNENENLVIFKNKRNNLDNFNQEKAKNNLENQAKMNFFGTDIHILIKQMKTYRGSMYLQYLLTLLDNSDVEQLLLRLSPHLTEVMCSHYGNYFIQKFFQKLNYHQRLFIFSIIQNNFLDICIDKSGTYSIQSLIDTIKTPFEEKIIENLLYKNLLLLFCNENSHHIIQKIIIDYPEYKRDFLNNFLLGNLNKICTNLYGSLCVIKFIIMNSNLYIRFQLIRAIQSMFFNLVLNRYGCSIIFFLLEKYGIEYCYFIIEFIKQNFEFLLNQPNSIILIEKVLNYMYKYVNNEFNDIVWKIIKNEKILYILIEKDLCNRILTFIIKTLNSEQKDLIKKTINNFLYKDKSLKEKVLHLII
jgi:hypothetical protein